MFFFSKSLKQSNYEEVTMDNFDKLKIGGRYILEFIPNSNTGEKYVELIPVKYQGTEYPDIVLVGKINPKCVGIINEYGHTKISRTIYLGITNFKFDFNIFSINNKIEESQ
jgi:hypothetical protein